MYICTVRCHCVHNYWGKKANHNTTLAPPSEHVLTSPSCAQGQMPYKQLQGVQL